MKRRPLIVHACAVFAAEIAVIATAIPAASVAAAVVLFAALFVLVIADMWLFRRLESREKSLLALVEKCAADQDCAYFEDLVPDDVLAAAGLKRGAA
ncbi:hypothetical protein AB0F17_08715 [Nonomuraea sp. NPDC026600]|uniref:hypothetical protein n=1 Tax=Nonomuraea sp. NPDC026600 TaxID=3155363 RepID=UPI0033DDC7B2